jgi:hypothetical protein
LPENEHRRTGSQVYQTDYTANARLQSFHSAAATLAGIKAAHKNRKGQLANTGIPAFRQFAALEA